ncbi:MAG: glycogen debranching protein, partial [Pedobacter sp.]|nr:glycogen debranching protein [Chitinophagaceae bacterium]
IYTSQWDNYPKQKSVQLNGSAFHIYLLMAGSTNPMQSRIANGLVIVTYKDGSADTLQLINPQTWWPIEQDYMDDGYAFTTSVVKPLRVHLKTGLITNNYTHYTNIKGFSNKAIDGGAATVLDMPLQASKQLQSLTIKTLTNDVVIGLMSATLIRNK